MMPKQCWQYIILGMFGPPGLPGRLLAASRAPGGPPETIGERFLSHKSLKATSNVWFYALRASEPWLLNPIQPS